MQSFIVPNCYNIMTPQERTKLESQLAEIDPGYEPELDKQVMTDNGDVLPNSFNHSNGYKVFIDAPEQRTRPIYDFVSALFEEEAA